VPGGQPPQINTIAVIGAGAAGRRIALATALAGYPTILEDLLPNALRRAEAEIRANLDRSVSADQVARENAEAAVRRIEYAGSIEDAARRADLVIEAVPDELDSKLEIFTLLDRICRPDTILALTASSLTVTEIAPITFRRNKCLGMRFTAPGDNTRSAIARVELIRGQETDEATFAAVLAVAHRLAADPL
jgi:3-hydroxybutyryl-CoA dehydrogenase